MFCTDVVTNGVDVSVCRRYSRMEEVTSANGMECCCCGALFCWGVVQSAAALAALQLSDILLFVFVCLFVFCC